MYVPKFLFQGYNYTLPIHDALFHRLKTLNVKLPVGLPVAITIASPKTTRVVANSMSAWKCLVMNTPGYVIVYLHTWTWNDLFNAKSEPFIPFHILDDNSDPVDCNGSQGHNMRKYCCFLSKNIVNFYYFLVLVFFECLG